MFLCLFLAIVHLQIIDYNLSVEGYYSDVGVAKQDRESLLVPTNPNRLHLNRTGGAENTVDSHRRRLSFWTTSLVEVRDIPDEGWEYLRLQTLYETAGDSDLSWDVGIRWGHTSRWRHHASSNKRPGNYGRQLPENRHRHPRPLETTRVNDDNPDPPPPPPPPPHPPPPKAKEGKASSKTVQGSSSIAHTG